MSSVTELICSHTLHLTLAFLQHHCNLNTFKSFLVSISISKEFIFFISNLSQYSFWNQLGYYFQCILSSYRSSGGQSAQNLDTFPRIAFFLHLWLEPWQWKFDKVNWKKNHILRREPCFAPFTLFNLTKALHATTSTGILS